MSKQIKYQKVFAPSYFLTVWKEIFGHDNPREIHVILNYLWNISRNYSNIFLQTIESDFSWCIGVVYNNIPYYITFKRNEHKNKVGGPDFRANWICNISTMLITFRRNLITNQHIIPMGRKFDKSYSFKFKSPPKNGNRIIKWILDFMKRHPDAALPYNVILNGIFYIKGELIFPCKDKHKNNNKITQIVETKADDDAKVYEIIGFDSRDKAFVYGAPYLFLEDPNTIEKKYWWLYDDEYNPKFDECKTIEKIEQKSPPKNEGIKKDELQQKALTSDDDSSPQSNLIAPMFYNCDINLNNNNNNNNNSMTPLLSKSLLETVEEKDNIIIKDAIVAETKMDNESDNNLSIFYSLMEQKDMSKKHFLRKRLRLYREISDLSYDEKGIKLEKGSFIIIKVFCKTKDIQDGYIGRENIKSFKTIVEQKKVELKIVN